MQRLLSAQETADLLRIGVASLRNRKIRKRLGLRAVKLGRLLRFRPEDVEQLMVPEGSDVRPPALESRP